MTMTTADRLQEALVPIAKHNVQEIVDDGRISPSARRLLFALFNHDPGDGSEVGGWGQIRQLFQELEDANYVMRGDAWKGQVGGHFLVFDRWQVPTQTVSLPDLPPKSFDREVLYVIGQPGAAIVKIGVTGNLRSRLKAIQTGSPVPLSVLWWHPGSYDLEAQIHAEFRDFRMEGEWFNFGLEEPDLLTESAVQRLRPEEFPPLIGPHENFSDYLQRYPPGCRYEYLLSALPAGPVRFPRRSLAAETLVLVCDACTEPITDRAPGYLWIDRDAVEQAEREVAEWQRRHGAVADVPAAGVAIDVASLMEYPATVRWQVHHVACDPRPEASAYDMSSEAVRTWEQLLGRTAHLMEKSWLHVTDWQQLLLEVRHGRKRVASIREYRR